MNLERTLIIIKPDTFSKKLAGKVIAELEEAMLKPVGAKMILLNTEQAKKFYAEHKGKDFYEPLVEFMTSNPVMVIVFEGEDAISRARTLIGATDPADAEEGTIRRRWAQDGRHNIIHGSDSVQSAEREIEFFFPDSQQIFPCNGDGSV